MLGETDFLNLTKFLNRLLTSNFKWWDFVCFAVVKSIKYMYLCLIFLLLGKEYCSDDGCPLKFIMKAELLGLFVCFVVVVSKS